jgi:ribosome maturation factor RimP
MTRRAGRRSRPSAEVVAGVRPIAERFARAHGLVVWSVGLSRVAGRDALRIAVDRVGGVRSDELALLAEDLGRELDHSDAVPGDDPYVLEVTSPGAERRLAGAEQFRICRGLVVRVWFRDGRPPLDGVIGDGDEDAVVIESSSGAQRVRYEEMDRAQLRVTEIG